ncbi:hypothetical protein [Haloarchaeobius sp. HME9146]|uniref:hypothetical protein n=1 Tax=Haloarchaeobius sp. HME9146 TaxID=2978732 RepID=UPI0021C00EFD|nr:hypothetical protein [Haloarchaeobius sp. HME9146]MCT9096741.1 hypothetical protein [Haloarchaeobius sp. HME9146]
MHRRELLAALGLVGVSGCLRLDSASPQTARTTSTEPDPTETVSTQTATDTQTNTETTSAGPAPYPTGLDEEGPNLFLLPSHTQALRQTSFRVAEKKRNLSKTEVYRDREYRSEGGEILGSLLGRDGSRVDIFRTSEDAYWRENLGGSYTYGNDKHRNNKRYEWTLWIRELSAFLKAGNWGSPEVVQEGPTTIWRVQADSLDEEGVVDPGTGGTITDVASGELTVDEDGIIRSLTARIAEDLRDGGEQVLEATYTVDSLGSVSVSPPSWVATASEQAPTLSVSVTDDDSFVKLRIESGRAIAAGSVFQVFDRAKDGGVIDYRLEEPLEPGTTAYLYRGGDSFARGSPPAEEPTETLTNSYDVWARRRGLHYFKTYEVES